MNHGKVVKITENPQLAADHVMNQFINICSKDVKGAHDADFVIVNKKAYVVFEANDVQPGEHPAWPYIYVTMSIVNIEHRLLEDTIMIASSQMQFENETLPEGACFVPRVIQKDEVTIRIFFASEQPGVRESQTWYIDFNTTTKELDRQIYRAKLKTSEGLFAMQPEVLYRDAARKGFARAQHSHGMYITDSFKKFDERIYAVLNNFPIGQNALAVLNEELDTFEILGHYNEPLDVKLTESAINRLPDGTWVAISRREDGDKIYMFSHSHDGIDWSPHQTLFPVMDGSNSKPTFDFLQGMYYLGWQGGKKINDVSRSVYHLCVSTDGVTWAEKYRFESEQTFQYPVFKEYEGKIYVAVTQGQKQYICFGSMSD